MLRLAFDEAMAEVCPLIQEIKDWEIVNPPDRVLS